MVFNAWAFWSTVRDLLLQVQSFPLLIYVEGPGLLGAVLPALISFLILFRYRNSVLFSQILSKNLLIGLIFASLAIGMESGYWTSVGYHFFDLGMIFWPMLALVSNNFPPALAYPLTYFPGLVVDFVGAGEHGHWAGCFWYGIGGAGLYDGLFQFPLTAFGAAAACAYLGKYFYKMGWLHQEMI